MVQIKTGGRSEQVRRGAEHVLFVEGREDGLDQVVLRALLGNSLRVEVMGPSYSVRSAAQALARHHPRYYFLIDRDHYDDEFVEKSWQDFPDPNKRGLTYLSAETLGSLSSTGFSARTCMKVLK